MKVTQLRKLFDRLPAEMTRALGRKEFPVCWYGSAGLDFKLIQEINKQDSPIGFRPNVFIYTDVSYKGDGFGFNYFKQIDPNGDQFMDQKGWEYLSIKGLHQPRMQRISFTAVPESSRDALIIWLEAQSGEGGEIDQFVILIDCSNQLFEKTTIGAGLQFEIVCEAGGMSNSHRPLRLGDLGAEWSLGYVPRFIGDGFRYQCGKRNADYDSLPGLSKVPFYSEHITETGWGVNGGSNFPLRKIIRLNLEDYPNLSIATAIAVERGYQHIRDEDRLSNHSLILDHLKILSPWAARSLVQHHCDLSFNGLEILDPEIVPILASHIGSLYLNGLNAIDDACVKPLASHHGDLHLNGLKKLTADMAVNLAGIRGNLYFSGLDTLHSDAAMGLAPHEGTLYLDSIQSMDQGTAKALSNHHGSVSLKGIVTLTDEIAEYLGAREDISFGEIKSLTPRAAASMAMRSGQLNLDSMKRISRETAHALSSHTGNLSLNGIKKLSPKVAEALAGHQGTLWIDGIKTLEPIAAKPLSKHRGVLFLNGIESLPDESSKKLMGNLVTDEPGEEYCRWRDRSWNAEVSRDRKWAHLTRHDWVWEQPNADHSCILVICKSPLIDLHGGPLTEKIAKLITEAKEIRTFVRSCSSISKNSLEILSKYQGELVLDGSTLSLSLEDADTLANYPGKLSLPDFSWETLI
jgi:Fe-S cluster biogenesis protein NfuA